MTGAVATEGPPSSLNEDSSRAEGLVGLTLNDQWIVVKKISRRSDDTGGSRSVCYQAVTPNGHTAFVKAFDFRLDEDAGDTKKLERSVREFNHEKDLHEYYRDLNRVTQIYDHGKIKVDGYNIHFIVCEYAETSFRSHHPPGDDSVLASERLYALKKIALALLQLHQADVAHQDLKPSNAVRFQDERIKITDLGSASCTHMPAPHDADVLVGQPTYAPYELLYPSGLESWNKQRRRFGCDAFLLGNLIFTVFVGGSLSVLLLHAIPGPMHPIRFDGRYEEVLPFLITEHFALAEHFLREKVPDVIAADLSRLVLSLCHPDPRQRGLGKGFDGEDRQLDLVRCIGTLNTLAQRAELHEQRHQRQLAKAAAG